MASFNERVTSMVNRYLRSAQGRTANEKVHAAFRAIQAHRQAGCVNDSVTVAAEHYLFTRYLTGSNLLVGSSWFATGIPINIGYDLVKELMKTFGGDFGVTDCPTSEAHCWIRIWAHLGAGDGFSDRDETHPASPSPSAAGFSFMCFPYEAPTT